MAERMRCEICNQEFKDAGGLAQHKAAKHTGNKAEEKKPRNYKKYRNWGIALIALGLIIWGVSAMFSGVQDCKTAPVTEVNIGGHNNLALHIHTDLAIMIDGKRQNIPPNVGILPGVMRPLHTHDATNHIHIEGQCQRDFKIGEFFSIWNKRFDSQCIFNYCTNNGTLTFTVNDQPNNDFENYEMKDGDLMVIEYKANTP